MDAADLILHNARVLSFDPAILRGEAVAVKAGRVIAVCSDDDILAFRGKSTVVIDCCGGAIIPGFHDAHCHPVGLAESLISVDVNPESARSIDEIKSVIHRASDSLPAGKWIRAGRYNEFYLAEKRHPTRYDLDQAAPHHPVKLSHRSGHAHVLNSCAMAVVGISTDTADPPGGLIERDSETGEPNGIVYNMGRYLAKAIPPLSPDEIDAGIKLAGERFVQLGVTSLQDASERNDIQRWHKYQRWKQKGLLRSRVSMMMGFETFCGREDLGITSRMGDDMLRIGAVKIVLAETTGTLYPPLDALKKQALDIHGSGFQAAFHAVEPATVDAACAAIAHALQSVPRSDHRHRIEHCSECTAATARRIAALGIAVVTQPSFVYYSGDRYLRTVPKANQRHLYAFSTMRKAGIVAAAGSDTPVVPPDPLSGIYAAVTRGTSGGQILQQQEGITLSEALAMYTSGAAYSCFNENISGTITPGKFADLVVLNDDPANVSIEAVKDMRVTMTIIGGDIVWRSAGFSR